MKKHLLLLTSVWCFMFQSNAQGVQNPSAVTQAVFLGKSQPVRDLPTHVKQNFGKEELIIVPNNFEGSFENLVEGKNGNESNMQREKGAYSIGGGIGVNFDGIDQNQTGFVPPDPTGAVGPNHYVQAVNASFSIYDKTGTQLTGPTSMGSFFGSNDNGDPIILYDQLADRWIISQFGDIVGGPFPNSLLFAISETSDPTGSYFMYEILEGRFEDYPHYSVWPDGYYLTTNAIDTGGGNPRDVFVLERDAMLVGDPNAQLITFQLTGHFANPTTVFSPAAANLTGTEFPPDTPGYFIYLQDDSWDSSITEDHLLIWETDIDWDDVTNSNLSAPTAVTVNSFDSLFTSFGIGDIEQPGTNQKLSGQGGRVSYNANYRTFATHNSWLITFNEDVDGNDTSGIRWIELRNTAEDTSWSVFQEGTYAPADGNSRFMSSAAMDIQGNIGLAFNIGSASLATGISYTGRFNGDKAGQMTIAETAIIDGIGVQTLSNRFGDYAHLTMDPNDFTFWHTSQYFQATNSWATRITSFNISGGFPDDVGAIAFVDPVDGLLTNAETVTVTILNFGTDPQSNFPVELSLDGNVVATETFTGTLAAGEMQDFTFAQTVDLSTEGQVYVLAATTLLANDQRPINNDVQAEVRHLFSDDVGIAALDAPNSGTLGDAETITVEITNFGSNTQTTIPVSYILDGGDIVEETYNGSIAQGENDTYTFTTMADFSFPGDHTLVTSTNLASDQDTTNDELEVTIRSMACVPTGNCTLDDGVTQIQLVDQDIITNCGMDSDGYSDDTDVIFNFALDQNSFDGTLQMGFNDSSFAIWIDFNDNSVFEVDELIITDDVLTANTDFNFTIDLSSIPTVTPGMHVMRVRGEDTNQDGDVLNPCDDLEFGRTNDYTANIIEALNVEALELANSELRVTTLEGNRFDVDFRTDFNGEIQLSVFNIIGQQLTNKVVARRDSGYGLILDLSRMPAGVYILRLQSPFYNVIKKAKVIVQ